ncbi:MAG: hypothetical protein V9H69_17365 [Anaerolineae bacterium]
MPADRLAGVEGGDVRGRGGGKLRGDLGDAALLHEAAQEGQALAVALEKTPAEGIDEEEDHLAVALWQGCEAIRRQALRSIRQQHRFDEAGQVGKTAALVAGSDELRWQIGHV